MTSHASGRIILVTLIIGFFVQAAEASIPKYSFEDGGIRITGVGPGNPMIYDNDWWKDVPDAAYLWAKVSLVHRPVSPLYLSGIALSGELFS